MQGRKDWLEDTASALETGAAASLESLLSASRSSPRRLCLLRARPVSPTFVTPSPGP